MKNLDVAIVGGSLAGCSAAILLRREGHTVHVCERSTGQLVGRGGGIGTPTPVLKEMIEQDIIDADFPNLPLESASLLIRTPEHLRLGYCPLHLKGGSFRAFHWSALWNSLRKRLPDENYHAGREVVGAESVGDKAVMLQFRDGSAAQFDLVLFADGYQSLGRQLFFPDSELQYRGYMAWRGLLPEREISDSSPLGNQMPRMWFPELQGNFAVYFIPGHDGNIGEGHRTFNWAANIPLPAAEVTDFMIDRDGNAMPGSIPPGKMRLESENRLKRLMRENLPTYYGDIVEASRDTFVQLIYTCRPSAYQYGRIILIGDAGVVAQPFTGSGIFKGLKNAKDLIQALKTFDSIEEGLQHWGKEQQRIGDQLLAYGKQAEQALMWKPLDFARADEQTAAAWWKSALTPPAEFPAQASRPSSR